MSLHRRDHQVAQGGRVLLDVSALLLKDVVTHDRGQGHQDADGCGHQGLGNGAHHVAHTAPTAGHGGLSRA